MKILVGSVFAADDDVNHQWLDLQLKFLRATTPDFEHVAVIWGGKKTDNFSQTNSIFPDDNPDGAGECHLSGLNIITSYFREREKEFTHFLYLDSDAFPIKVGWGAELANQMQEQPVMEGGSFTRMVGRNYEIAIVVRAENLENRLHASVLFVKGKFLSHVSFHKSAFGMDLRGNSEMDIHLPEYEAERRDQAFALMRSNKHNVHPLACGVYYNMFYHHGCGSKARHFLVRGNSTASTAKPYWDSFGDLNTEGLTEQLLESPSSFVSNLAGWTPSRYAILS